MRMMSLVFAPHKQAGSEKDIVFVPFLRTGASITDSRNASRSDSRKAHNLGPRLQAFKIPASAQYRTVRSVTPQRRATAFTLSHRGFGRVIIAGTGKSLLCRAFFQECKPSELKT